MDYYVLFLTICLLYQRELKKIAENNLKIDMKNLTCYYFDDIININDFDLDNILLEKKIT